MCRSQPNYKRAWRFYTFPYLKDRSKIRTLFDMLGSLIHHLCCEPTMQIIRAMLLSPGQRHLRDLANNSSLSPAGVSDILRRLKDAGVLAEKRVGNRRCLQLNLSSDELDCLKQFFLIYENTTLRRRAAKFSQRASEKLKWMDEAYEFYHGLKKARHDPA